jgi:hypothetical protein
MTTLNGPRKIVLIRAGRYDYAEVELDGSLQIVGPNNTGKTTLINTLQFLYLDDSRKMDFGAYNLEETLSYYFPGQYSYLLFECLGSTGVCVIGWRGQSQTTGGDPGRFCYLRPFAAEDFLTAEHQVREPRDVNARLAVKDFRILKSPQEHRELLLPASGVDGRGLGLVAIRDVERYPRFRESLKDLLSLSTITQEEMRERLLTLADVRTDVPALDVRRLFGEDYDLIRRRRDSVARFKRNAEHVRLLVDKFAELTRVRGELIARWDDLRPRRIAFEQAHNTRVAELTSLSAAEQEKVTALSAQIVERGTDRDACIQEKGAIQERLATLAKQARTFAEFEHDLVKAAEANLRRDELRLSKLLSDAETETREKAQTKVELYAGIVRHKEESIANFDRLAITALRRHFTDEELARAFRVLSFELLETPVGLNGIEVRDEARLLDTLRELDARVRDGVYADDAVRVVLRESRRSISELTDVKALREQLEDESAQLKRAEAILKAIVERERLTSELKICQSQLQKTQRSLFDYESFIAARAETPRIERDLHAIDQKIIKLDKLIATLEKQRKTAETNRDKAERDIVTDQNGFNEVMGRFGQCIFPEFIVPRVEATEIPDDFSGAVGLFLRQQDKEEELANAVRDQLRVTASLVGEQFNGADDSETVRNLTAELEALVDKSDALERDWNALIQGMRGMFAAVLKELDAVRSVVTDLNRQFGRVRVSNLKAIKLEVLESGDLVSWVKRLVNLEQPGLFDDDTQLDQTLRNFRDKFASSPLISFAQLFSLQFTVVGPDDAIHRYQDLRQIESDGTTIMVKVLSNLLILRRYLREGQCIVPFFLDEIQDLDPANRAELLSTARKLGFVAITAAPEAVSEVDALYFLQPQNGRIVLRHRHRLNVKLQANAT